LHIEFSGIDTPGEDGGTEALSLLDAVAAEVRARLGTLADVTFAADDEDITEVPVSPLAESPDEVVVFGNEDSIAWQHYAKDAGTDVAGQTLPDDAVTTIDGFRSRIPVESSLVSYGKGHVFFGNRDRDRPHLEYLKQYLAQKAQTASAADKRKIAAFAAFQGREGSTAAINTYDDQIVTWGTGFSGRALMGTVVEKSLRSSAVRTLFTRAGVRYRQKNNYDIVDVSTKRVVTGKEDALQIMRASLPLLYMLIYAARDTTTRDAVTDAQLEAFMMASSNFTSADQIATQALFNLVTHLKHWAPGYIIGGLEWALPQAGDGPPSEARDKRLAPLLGRYFYGKARGQKFFPKWEQFQKYWRDMKDDGLNCMDDPFIKASAAPTDDPFVEHPLTTQPSKPSQPTSQVGPKNPPLAGNEELDAIAAGTGTLKRGKQGPAVEAVQKALLAVGIQVSGGADGIFGGGTEAAVIAFQKKQKLGVDGIVGRGTLGALDAALGALGK
jgi:hypothetical protein